MYNLPEIFKNIIKTTIRTMTTAVIHKILTIPCYK